MSWPPRSQVTMAYGIQLLSKANTSYICLGFGNIHEIGFCLWFPFFSHFDLSQKTRNFKPFIAINDKKTIKILPYKIVKIALKIWHRLNNSPSFLLEKLWASLFINFCQFYKSGIPEDILGLWKIIKNGTNLAKKGKKWRKSIYRLSSPIYRR